MPLTVFYKDEVIARGEPPQFAEALRALEPLSRSSDLLAFDDETGRQTDLDLTQSGAEAAATRPRGRPSLGVQAREVTLLPRHWEWLGKQPGGASVNLRKLVETAMRKGRSARDRLDAACRFLTVMAGDRPGYEEAVRALYAGEPDRFAEHAAEWPAAIRDHAQALAWGGSAS